MYDDRPAHDGGVLSFDGMCYDYRDSHAFKSIKLWCPPGPAPIRALVLFGNPGTTGDTRNKALNRSWQEWAAQRNFALAGVTCFPGANIYEHTAKDILQVLSDWSAFGKHPELSTVPLIPRGSSNAGITAYGLSCYAPERILCFSSNVGPNYNPHTPPDALLNVPFMCHIGPIDKFFPLGVKDTADLFARIHDKHPLWAWEAEEHKGHMDMSQLHTDLAFYSDVIDRRLPPGINNLCPMSYDDGWCADTQTWNRHATVSKWGVKDQISCLTDIAPAADYTGSQQGRVWLPGPGTAKAYQASASHRRLRHLSIRHLSSMGSSDGNWDINDADLPLVEANQSITLCVDDSDAIPKERMWESITFYNGEHEVGTITRKQHQRAELDHTITSGPIEQVFTAVATDSVGRLDITNPFGVVVRDSNTSERITEHMRAYHRNFPIPKPLIGSHPTFATKNTDLTAPPEHGVVSAQPLDNTEAQALQTLLEIPSLDADALTSFWETAPPTFLSQHMNLTSPPPDNVSLEIRALYCKTGLGLLMVLNGEELGPGDIAEWHISPQDPHTFNQVSPLNTYLSPSRTLLTQQSQFRLYQHDNQVRVSINTVRGNLFQINAFDFDLNEANDFGLSIQQSPWLNGKMAFQWFLPWPLVGMPQEDRKQPEPGAQLAIVIGCPHTSKAIDNEGPTKLRWPYNRDPWDSVPNHFAAANDKIQPHQPVWGTLILHDKT